MVRAPCCEKMGVKRGPWTTEEDEILISYIQEHGHGNWRALPKQAGLLRCGKSCRLRWTNYLRPDIKRGNFTKEEEETIIKLHEKLGNRWSAIAARLPGRTDNEIKNVWHTNLKKKLKDYQPSENTKGQLSSNLPRRGSKVPKQIDQSTTSNCSTPLESSSEMSSITDYSSAGNMNSNQMIEIKSEGMNTSEYLPQIDESFWSEEQVCNDQLDIKHEEMDSQESNNNGSFLSKEFPTENSNTQSFFQGIAKESLEILDYSSTSTCNNNVCGSKIEEDMDFWFNLFIKFGDIPEFS